jgi:ketosteroid isomerase-like protein
MKSSPRAFAMEWIAAWNSHKLDRIMDHYADEVEFTSPLVASVMGRVDGTVRGKETLRNYFFRSLQTYPELKFELRRVYSGMGSVVVEYASVKGMLAAETLEFGPDGKVVRVRAHYADQ